MHNVNWDALQVFLAVARTGRISAAARRLAVEHTTVARRLAALEAQLGVPLFYRTSAGYVLTPHGKNALPQAETMGQAALALAARAREASAVDAGRVRVAMAPEFGSHWLAPRLPDFRVRHPRIDLHVLVGTRQRDLARGEAELAIQSPRPRQKGVISVRIAKATLGLYASRALASAGNWRVAGSDSPGRPLLVYTRALQMLQEAAWFQPLLAGANVVLETNSTHVLLEAARAGAGVAVLPRFVARAHEDLIAVSDDVAGHDVWLITHPEFRRDPRIRAVADFLKSIAGELSPPVDQTPRTEVVEPGSRRRRP
jgi:DNA-binding transcriptional LysR family regulator